MRCSECGLSFVDTSPQDRRLHRRVHDEALNGPRCLGLRNAPVVWKTSSRAVVVINSQSPRVQRLVAQEISLIAAEASEYSDMAYIANTPQDEREIHLFIGMSEDRAQAYVCFEKRSRVWKCSWPEYERGVAQQVENCTIWSIGYAWVSRNNRRMGWLRSILAAAQEHLGFVNNFGWYIPFSCSGEAAARALCPLGIFIAK